MAGERGPSFHPRVYLLRPVPQVSEADGGPLLGLSSPPCSSLPAKSAFISLWPWPWPGWPVSREDGDAQRGSTFIQTTGDTCVAFTAG